MKLRFASASLAYLLLLSGCDSSSTAPPPATDDPTLPVEIRGSTLVVTEFTGDALVDAADAAWRDALAALGVAGSALSLAIAVPQDSTIDLEIGAFRVAGLDWAPRLQVFADDMEAAGGGVVDFERRQIGGRSVQRATRTDDPALAPSYYYPWGEVLYFLRAEDDALAAEVLSELPSGPGAGGAASRVAAVEPAAGRAAGAELGHILLGSPRLPVFPACVGAPPLPHQIITFVSMVSGAAGIFPYQVLVSVQAPFGTTLPSVVHGFVHDFRYESRQFGLGTAETLHVQASAPATVGPVAQQWPLRVQHCLNGLWQDGPRILRVRQTLTAVTATIQEGTLSCGEGGQAFSGPLETTGPVGMVAGSDLKVCNPEACVAAGHLPTTELKSYTGTVSDDGRTVTVEWERQLFDREYDDEGNLTSCPATEAVQETFSIGRLIFGPDTPF